MKTGKQLIDDISSAVVKAATNYTEEQREAYRKAIRNEENSTAQWILEKILENERVAAKSEITLCDDTGIPQLFLEIGENCHLTADLIEIIHAGIAEGLKQLPGRPMAVIGDDIQRLEQSQGLDDNPGAMVPSPMFIKKSKTKGMKLHILLQGGGPEIRGKTYRIFHKHKLSEIIDEIIRWASEEVPKLGCTPCTPAIGIGRTHYEATTLMLEAMVKGKYGEQTTIEKEITRRINGLGVGPLGLGGGTTALGTFLCVGPQRASGVRIVCLRLCCIVEPRLASIVL